MGSYAKHNETNCFPLVPMQNIVVLIVFMKTPFGVSFLGNGNNCNSGGGD